MSDEQRCLFYTALRQFVNYNWPEARTLQAHGALVEAHAILSIIAGSAFFGVHRRA